MFAAPATPKTRRIPAGMERIAHEGASGTGVPHGPTAALRVDFRHKLGGKDQRLHAVVDHAEEEVVEDCSCELCRRLCLYTYLYK